MNVAAWYLFLQQEFVYNRGDDGTFSPGDRTRREGVDLSARYQFTPWLFANFDINFCRARDIQAAKGSDYLPLAVPLSGTGGIYVKMVDGLNGGLSCRYMKNRPANEDNSLVAQGYFVTDLSANYTRRKYELGLEIQNLFNTSWREAQFEVMSAQVEKMSPARWMISVLPPAPRGLPNSSLRYSFDGPYKFQKRAFGGMPGNPHQVMDRQALPMIMDAASDLRAVAVEIHSKAPFWGGRTGVLLRSDRPNGPIP